MRAILFLFVLFLLAGSCTKDEPLVPLCKPEKYFPLEIGNYWIFQYFKVYNNGHVDSTNDVDSLYISSDTLMLGYRYYHLKGSFHRKPMNYYLAHVDGQIVSVSKYVFYECPRLFNSEKLYPVMGFDFPATLNTTRMNTPVSVPAGDFDPVMLFEAHSMLEDTIRIVTYKAYYAKNVGMVKFSAKPEHSSDYESFSELVRYHVGN